VIVSSLPKWPGNFGIKSRVLEAAWRYGAGVSVFAPSDGAPGSLRSVQQSAGAVVSTRDGRPAVIHYGSPAGELAVCVRAVGLLDRSDLAKLVIEAAPAQLTQLVTRMTGATVAIGGSLLADGAWWCGAAEGRVIVVCEPAVGSRLLAGLRAQRLRHVGVSVTDRTQDWAAIELLGRNTAKVLATLGIYGESGDPRLAPPFGFRPVAGIDAFWLLESDRQALALVPDAFAGHAWRAIELAGRPFGISCVGSEAARRFALLERSHQPPARVR
jgi:glycine cleavage system aminomethyltransferase T